jgi:hypothetical protein
MKNSVSYARNNHHLDESMVALWKGTSTLATIVSGAAPSFPLNSSLKMS